jgi:hypothetical protein
MEHDKDQIPNLRKFIRNFLIELALYGALVVGYFFVALRFLGEPLAELFGSNLPVYALASLGLIVAQGFLLDVVVTYLLNLIGLDHIE